MSIFKWDYNDVIEKDHELRRVKELVSFQSMVYRIKDLSSDLGRNGYGLERALEALYLQFAYDLSDRQMEKRLRYDITFRWFCGFDFTEQTPDHTWFCKVRNRIGTARVAKLFQVMTRKLKESGLISEVFTFVDSSQIVAKETTWAERDKALAAQEKKLNNTNISKHAADKDARYGCKGKKKFWFGYKRHVSVDMKQGFIQKVAVTAANVTDADALKHVCPGQGMVLGDKGYCTKQAQDTLLAHRCHDGTIKRNNMKGKDRDKDRWLSGLRAPFENVFSGMVKRARYRGQMKVQLQAFMEAFCFNIKRLSVIGPPPDFCIA